MKKWILNSLATVISFAVILMANNANGAASMWMVYQPEEPKKPTE